MALPITGGNGSPESQANTQTPQTSVGPATGATSSGSVQPGTASSLLTTSAGGISLTNQVLPTVTVSATSTGTVQTVKPAVAPAKHHANPALIGIAILLLVCAVIFFWTTARSAKNTTD